MPLSDTTQTAPDTNVASASPETPPNCPASHPASVILIIFLFHHLQQLCTEGGLSGTTTFSVAWLLDQFINSLIINCQTPIRRFAAPIKHILKVKEAPPPAGPFSFSIKIIPLRTVVYKPCCPPASPAPMRFTLMGGLIMEVCNSWFPTE